MFFSFPGACFVLLIVLLLVRFSCFGIPWCFDTTNFEQKPGDFTGAPDCAFAGAFVCAPDCAFAGALCCALDCVFAGAFLCS